MTFKEIITTTQYIDTYKIETKIRLENWTIIIFEDDDYEIYATDQTTWKKYEIIEFLESSQIVNDKKIFSVRLENDIFTSIDENANIVVITDWNKKYYPNLFRYFYCHDTHDIFWHHFWPAHIYWYFDINNCFNDDDDLNFILINKKFEPYKTKDWDVITWINYEYNNITFNNKEYFPITVLDKNTSEQELIFKGWYINENFNTLKADNIYLVKNIQNKEPINLFNKKVYRSTIYLNSNEKIDAYITIKWELLKTNENDIICDIVKEHNFSGRSIFQVKTEIWEDKFIDENLNVAKLEIK